MPAPGPTRLAKWFDPRLHSAASSIHGTGLFARAPVDAGEVLMIWGGVLIALAEYDPGRYRPTSTTLYDDAHYLTTPIAEPVSLDEALNHSCDPNLWMNDEVTAVARRPIAAGEELTTDYACWSDYEHVLTRACGCRSPQCRGVISGFDWRLPALQSRYEGHFLPCINRRFALLRRMAEPLTAASSSSSSAIV